MKHETTILIPAHNRPYCLRRLISFYEPIPAEWTILIADSSRERIRKKNRSVDDFQSNESVRYKEYATELSLVEKIGHTLSTVDTEFTVLCANDDFIIPSGIDQATRFLTNHKSFSAAHGEFIGFQAEFDDSDIQFDWNPIYPHSTTIDNKNPAERLYDHHANYMQTFYSVHRTPSIQEGFESAVEATTDVRFGELLPSMTAIINGKFKHLNVFYGARCTDQQGLGSTADNFIDFIQAGTFTSKYDRYRDSLAGHLEARSKLTYDESLKAVDDAMISYLINSYGLTQEGATNLVKEGRAPEIYDSESLPVRVRDWLQTTPVPEQIISKLEEIYRYKNRYENLLRSQDSKQSKFNSMVDETEALKQVQESVKSHPRALDE